MKRSTIGLVATISSAVFVLSVPTFAADKPTDKPTKATGAATRTFQEGLRLYKKNDFEGARVHFRQTYVVYPSAEVLENLALAEFHTGRYVEALRHFKTYAKMPNAKPNAADNELRPYFQTCNEKTGHALIRVPPYTQVTLDGEAVDTVEATDMAPGSHTVIARGPNLDETRTFSVAEGQSIEIAFRVPEPKKAVVVAPLPVTPPAPVLVPAASKERPASESSWTGRQKLALGLGIGAGVALGTAGVFVALAADQQSKARSAGNNPCPSSSGCSSFRDAVDARQFDTTVALVAASVGGALALTSAVFWLWPGAQEKPTMGAWVAPSIGKDGALMTWGGRF